MNGETTDTTETVTLLDGAETQNQQPGTTQQTQTQTPAITVNQDGTLPDNWFTALGEEYNGLSKFKNVADLAKSYRHLESKSIHYPEEGATPEQVAAFRSLAGVPETAEGYELKAPDKLPDGVQWDDASAKRFSDVAHKYHVPKAAMQALMAEQVKIESERVQSAVAEQAGKIQKDLDALRNEWGTDTQARLGTVKTVFGKLAAQTGLDPKSPEGIALQNSPGFVKMLYAMSKFMTEDSLPAGVKSQTVMGGRERANDIINNPDNPYYKKYWDGDEGVQAMISQMLKG